jgi:hypothetical protein
MRTFRKGCASSNLVRTFEEKNEQKGDARVSHRTARPKHFCSSGFSPLFSSALRHSVTAFEDEGDPQITQLTQILNRIGEIYVICG